MDGVSWISQTKGELTDTRYNNLNKLLNHEQQVVKQEIITCFLSNIAPAKLPESNSFASYGIKFFA